MLLLFVSPYRLLQSCRSDSVNVTVPLRMLEIFSSEKTYLPVLLDASCVASLIEQILHYMVHKGKVTLRSLRGWRGTCATLCEAFFSNGTRFFVVSGYYRSLYMLVNFRLPSSLEYSNAPRVPLASTLLEHTLKPLHFTYGTCSAHARYAALLAWPLAVMHPWARGKGLATGRRISLSRAYTVKSRSKPKIQAPLLDLEATGTL